jgi:hypothetical protein
VNSRELEHVLRAIDSETDREHRFLLLGSQAVLAHLDPEHFDSDVLFVSREIDVAVLSDDEALQEKIADLIDRNFGELSWFHKTHGYHADGVEISTPILAPGWKGRLRSYEYGQVTPGRFQALSFQDLAVSKLMAGREKDLDFVKAMCDPSIAHPSLSEVSGLLRLLPESSKKELALRRWEVYFQPPAIRGRSGLTP